MNIKLQSIKKAVALCLFFFTAPFFGQSAGFNSSFVILSVNGGSNTYYDLQAATTNPDFNGLNLGSFCQGSSGVVFKGAEHNNYKCGTCTINTTQISYRVYLTSGLPSAFINKSIGFVSEVTNACGGRDQQWSSATYTDDLILGANLPPGNYTFEVYSSQQTSCSGIQYANNSGLNYKAYFTVLPNTTYYKDTDADGYGNPAISQLSCLGLPIGFVTSNSDCDDTKVAVHPGLIDVCYDGLDNDCNGVIDNVGMPGGCVPKASTLVATSCGVTLTTIDDLITASLVSNTQGYRWRVTKIINGIPSTNPSDIQVLDTGLRQFKISQLPIFTYNTTYKIEVCVNYNGVWQPYYGAACNVRTPDIKTKVTTAQCGITLTNLTDIIYADIVAYATGYRFKITNLLNPSDVQIIDRSLREFRFSLLNVQFYAPYKVEVAVRNTDGTYLSYGTSCTITMPSFPITNLQNSQCDYTATSMTDYLVANMVANATLYRFSITCASINYAYVFDLGSRWFLLNTVPGLQPNTTYTVAVAVQVNGITGPYGKPCTVTTPSFVARNAFANSSTMASSYTFEVHSVPNPFSSSFMLDVTNTDETLFQVKVYNQIGQLIDAKVLNLIEMKTLELGADYPPGVYNVIVTQGETTKTLREIKR